MAFLKEIVDDFLRVITCKDNGFLEWTKNDCIITRNLTAKVEQNLQNFIKNNCCNLDSFIKFYVHANMAETISQNPLLDSTSPPLNVTYPGDQSIINSLELEAQTPLLAHEQLLTKKSVQRFIQCLNLALDPCSKWHSKSLQANLKKLFPMALLCKGPEVIVIIDNDHKLPAKQTNQKIPFKLFSSKSKGTYFKAFTENDDLKEELILEKLKSVHLRKFKATTCSVNCTSKYALLSTVPTGKFVAAISSNKVKNVLAIEKSGITGIQVMVTPFPESTESLTYELHREITIIKGYLNYFEDENIIWYKHNPGEAIAKLHSLLQSFTTNQKYEKQESTLQDNLIKLTKRKELDFTEKVWEVIKEASSLKELVTCWEIIFNELSRKDDRSSQFWLHQNNATHLAKLVRMSYTNEEINFPSLHGDQPIRLLAEIGIEKLSNDFLDFFKKQRLATEKRILGFIRPSNEKSTTAMTRQLSNLNKLHHTMALWLLCRRYFDFKEMELYYKIQDVMKEYEKREISEHNTTTFDVSYDVIEKNIDGMQPFFWKLCLNSSVNNILVETNFCLTSSNPFFDIIQTNEHEEENISMNSDIADSDLSTPNLKYYCLSGNTVLLR